MRWLLIAALLCCCSIAHAASCTGAAQCVSVQYGGGSGSNVTTVSIAYSPSNTATNTLIAFAYLNCATAWGTLSDVSFQDSNGNSWDHNWMSQSLAGPTSNQQVYFGWANNVASGANTLTLNVVNHSDCQVIAVAYEYAGIVPIYTGGANDQIIVNVNGNTFGGSPTTFPVTTSGGGGSSPNLQLTFSVHDTGNTGTFGIAPSGSAVWNAIGTFNGSGASQIGSWDGGLGGSPQSVTVSNTGGSGYTTSVIISIVLNRSTPVPPPPPSGPTLTNYGQCAFVTSGTTFHCTFNPTNPDLAFISQWGYGADGAGQIASVTGCGANWLHVYTGGFNGFQDIVLATDLTPGSPCTVTGTFNSAVTSHGALIGQGEYIGVPTMPIAYYPLADDNSINVPSQVGSATYPFVTYEPNDVLVMIGESFNDCGFLGSTSGTTLTSHTAIRAPDPGCGQNNLGIIQAMDATIPAVGSSYSTTVVNNAGSISFFYPIIIRSQMPTGPAVVQRIPCSTTGGLISSLPCTPMTPPNSGDQWAVLTESDNGDAALSDNEGTCHALPSVWGNATLGLGYLCKNTNTLIPTFTLSSATNFNFTDVVVEELQGVDTTYPLYSGHAWNDVYHTNVGPNQNTFDVGPLSVPGGQCFLLLSFNGGPSNLAVTQTAGYNLRGSWPINYGNNIQYSYDQQVCPSVLTTGYDNTFTYAAAHGKLEGGTWAFGASQNTSFPLVRQTLPVLQISSSSAQPFKAPVMTGDAITVCAIGNSTTNLSISSTGSPSLTWHLVAGGGMSDQYAAWYTVAPSGGTPSVLVGGTFGAGGFVLWDALDNGNITAFDAANSNFNGAATTLSTGNITTTANHDWLNSCAATVNNLTNSFALPTNSLWSLNQYSPVDFGYIDGWSEVAGAAGTYSNTFDYVSTQPSAAIIFGFTTDIPPPSVTQQPHVTIALNGKDIPAYQIGAQ